MKTTINKLALVIALAMISTVAFAQGPPQGNPIIEFSYDASGNRICRQIIVIPPLKSQRDSTQSAVADESLNYNDTISGHDISIFPNPVAGILTIRVSNYSTVSSSEIRIYDMQGRALITGRCTSEQTQLDLSDLPAANYLMNIKLGNGVSRWKIVKQ